MINHLGQLLKLSQTYIKIFRYTSVGNKKGFIPDCRIKVKKGEKRALSSAFYFFRRHSRKSSLLENVEYPETVFALFQIKE
jgi:hypothetical protein